MKKKYKKKLICKNKGNALILVLGCMLLLSVMSITFVLTSTMEMKTGTMYSDITDAELLADAGIEFAIGQLKQIFREKITTVDRRTWLYSIMHFKNSEDNRIDNIEVAAGIPLDKIENYLENEENIDISVSFPLLTDNKISGHCSTGQYALKILDTTSQFPLNSHVSQHQINCAVGIASHDPYDNYNREEEEIKMGAMINTLSEEVGKLKQCEGLYDATGPFHGLGREIIKRRNELQGFTSKYDLLGEYENGKTITNEDLHYMWDYITVYPTWENMNNYNIYRNIAPKNLTENTYRIEYRVPVNINTASRPVLIAILKNLSMSEKNSQGQFVEVTSISKAEAEKIADKIIKFAQYKDIEGQSNSEEEVNVSDKTFTNWEAFYKFIDQLTSSGDVFTTDHPLKNALLKANFDPNVHLHESNPDYAVYQSLTKLNLFHYSTEFCFFPLGMFEISSYGKILDPNENLISSSLKQSLVSIFDCIYQTSQYDFECGPDGYIAHTTIVPNYSTLQDALAENLLVYEQNKPENRIGTEDTFQKGSDTGTSKIPGIGLNAFSFGNNTKKAYVTPKDLWSASSQLFGHIVPNNLHTITGCSVLDNNTYLFNLSEMYRTRQYPNLRTSQPKDFYRTMDDKTGLIQSPSIKGNLVSDGCILNDNLQHLQFNITENNFPPIDGEGLIHFWFKIDSQWDNDQEWRTVFFSDQTEDSPNFYGIQREIQFKIYSPNQTEDFQQDPFLRKMHIRFRHNLYGDINDTIARHIMKLPEPPKPTDGTDAGDATGGTEDGDATGGTEDGDATGESESTEFTGMYTSTVKELTLDPVTHYGIHTNKWYHLALRFHKGASMYNFEETANKISCFVLFGDFYKSEKKEENIQDPEDGEGEDGEDDGNEQSPGTGESYSQDIQNSYTVAGNYPPLYTISNPNNHNTLYIGSHNTDATEPPYMTIDEFCISNTIKNTIDDPSYLPSRFPFPQHVGSEVEIDDQTYNGSYGIFQSKIRSHDIEGDVTSITCTPRFGGNMGFALGFIEQATSEIELIDSRVKSWWEDIKKKYSDDEDKSKWKLKLTAFNTKITLKETATELDKPFNPSFTLSLWRKNFPGETQQETFKIPAQITMFQNDNQEIIIPTILQIFTPGHPDGFNGTPKMKWTNNADSDNTTPYDDTYLGVPYNPEVWLLTKDNISTLQNQWTLRSDNGGADTYNIYIDKKTQQSPGWKTLDELYNDVLYKWFKSTEVISNNKNSETIWYAKTIDRFIDILVNIDDTYFLEKTENDFRFTYSIRFPGKIQNTSSVLFNSPAVDDITVIYVFQNHIYHSIY
jgi:phage anti-repressor protein